MYILKKMHIVLSLMIKTLLIIFDVSVQPLHADSHTHLYCSVLFIHINQNAC